MAADHFPVRFPAPATPSDDLGSRGAPPRDRAGLRQAVFDKKSGLVLSLGAVAAGVGGKAVTSMASAFWKKAVIRLGRVRVEQQRAEIPFIAPPDGMEPHP